MRKTTLSFLKHHHHHYWLSTLQNDSSLFLLNFNLHNVPYDSVFIRLLNCIRVESNVLKKCTALIGTQESAAAKKYTTTATSTATQRSDSVKEHRKHRCASHLIENGYKTAGDRINLGWCMVNIFCGHETEQDNRNICSRVFKDSNIAYINSLPCVC